MRKIIKNFYELILAQVNYLKIKLDHLVNRKEQEKYFADLERLSGLSGIDPVAHQTAKSRLFNKMVDKALATIQADSDKIERLKKQAYKDAEDKILKNEEALANAVLLEAKTREIVKKKEKFEADWMDYMVDKDIVEDKQPDADDFADFLISHKYLTKKQLEKMTVSAIITDNVSVFNFRDFELEMNRVKND